MQQFVVPQFIDVENRIFGPITIRQFVIMLVAGLFIFISYKLADFGLFIVETVIIIFIFGLFAFFKINGRPLHYFILNFIQTLIKPRLRIWHKQITPQTIKDIISQPPTEVKILPARKQLISATRLTELALLIDTGGVYYREE